MGQAVLTGGSPKRGHASPPGSSGNESPSPSARKTALSPRFLQPPGKQCHLYAPLLEFLGTMLSPGSFDSPNSFLLRKFLSFVGWWWRPGEREKTPTLLAPSRFCARPNGRSELSPETPFASEPSLPRAREGQSSGRLPCPHEGTPAASACGYCPRADNPSVLSGGTQVCAWDTAEARPPGVAPPGKRLSKGSCLWRNE